MSVKSTYPFKSSQTETDITLIFTSKVTVHRSNSNVRLDFFETYDSLAEFENSKSTMWWHVNYHHVWTRRGSAQTWGQVRICLIMDVWIFDILVKLRIYSSQLNCCEIWNEIIDCIFKNSKHEMILYRSIWIEASTVWTIPASPQPCKIAPSFSASQLEASAVGTCP